jgi:transposase
MVLTDAQWAVLEPLIEACRPHRKTQHYHLRRTMEAIIWRCQNGARWRAVPEYGPPWVAAQCFIRWGKHRVWERQLSLVQEKALRPGMALGCTTPTSWLGSVSERQTDQWWPRLP